MALADAMQRPTDPEAYARAARPGLAKLMRALGLDVCYHRGEGDRLFWRDAKGREQAAWDFLGGYGANLFGHHHPALVATLRQALDEQAPMLAQASWRQGAGELAAALDAYLHAATGRRYVVTLASTGAEAVEAAWKAGLLRRQKRHEAFEAQFRRAAHALKHEPEALAQLRAEAARALPSVRWADGEGLLEALAAHNANALAAPPLALALDRAFHGKTSAATNFTHNPRYRLPFASGGPESWFLPFDDPAAWARATDAAAEEAWLPERVGGAWALVPKRFSRVALALAEAIQGEGGIHELAPEVAQAMRAAADRDGFLLVFDEIQAGLGRSGEAVAASALGVVADAYLFAKALGGGLAKVAAFAWDAALYDEDFGILHTSTFAEDEASCRVALAALRLVAEEDVAGRAQALGRTMASALQPVIDAHPGALLELRGRGLMLGLAFKGQADNPSNAIRMLADQGLLGYAVAAYLLHEEGIRVAPTLSSELTLRLEPSAFLPFEAIEDLVRGVTRVAQVLEGGDVARLTRHVVGLALPGDESPFADRKLEKPRREAPRSAKQVAFVGHFIAAEDATLWDPGLAAFPREALKRYQLAAHKVLGPTIYDQRHVRSALGEEVHLRFVGLNLTSKAIEAAMRAKEGAWVADKVKEAVLKAVEAGATMVGLGGYTSIVTDNGRSLLPHLPDGVGVTTGNAYTVAIGLQAIRRGAQELGLDLARARAAVVGATGNIGQVHARLLAPEVAGLLLLARPGSRPRLHGAASLMAGDAAEAARAEALGGEAPKGTHAAMLDFAKAQGLDPLVGPVDAFGKALASALLAAGPDAPLALSDDPLDLKRCQVGVSCSNSAAPVVRAEHLPEGASLWCDLAVPADVDPALAQTRPEVRVIRGGLVAVPNAPDFSIAGIPLPPGQAFACMSETLVLGLMGVREPYTVGPVGPERVRQVEAWAALHGFGLGEDKNDRSF